MKGQRDITTTITGIIDFNIKLGKDTAKAKELKNLQEQINITPSLNPDEIKNAIRKSIRDTVQELQDRFLN